MNIGPQVVFKYSWLVFTDTFITGLVISAIILVLAFLMTWRLKLIPGRLQMVGELFVTTFLDLIEGIIPGEGRRYLPMIGTILLFIGFSNLSGFVPFVNNPTADINTTVAYALCVFLVSQYAGIESKGVVNYVKGYFEPMFFFAPLNIIGELAKPVSHSFRLFGNMIGGGIILAIALKFIPWFLPIPLMAWFDLFAGVIQAFIFTMLSIVYIAVQKA